MVKQKQQQLQTLGGNLSGTGNNASVIALTGSGGAISCNSARLTNVATPTAGTDAATRDYVDLAAATPTLAEVLAAGNATSGNNLVISSGNSIVTDNPGVGTLTLNDKVLVNGTLNVNSNRILGVATPTLPTDAVNKSYADSLGGGGSQTLKTTLGLGNITDGYDIIISNGDVITGVDSTVLAAGMVTLKAGDSVSNQGGALNLFAGNSGAGYAGGDVNITAGTDVSDSVNGGNIILTSGDGLNVGRIDLKTGPHDLCSFQFESLTFASPYFGGFVTLAIEDSGHFEIRAGDHSDMHLFGGAGEIGNPDGGRVLLTPGPTTISGGNGGNCEIEGGSSEAGVGGSIVLTSGDGYVLSGSITLATTGSLPTSGAVEISSGGGCSLTSGNVSLFSGGGGNSGTVSIYSGSGGVGTSGSVSVSSGGGNTNSGNVNIETGSGTTNNTGNVNISSGAGATVQTGTVNINTGSGGSSPSGDINIGTGSNTPGSGDILITSGSGNATGDIQIQTGFGTTSGSIEISTGGGSSAVGDIILENGSGGGFIQLKPGIAVFIQNSTPAGTPVGGGYLYVENGALKYIGSNGNITTIASA